MKIKPEDLEVLRQWVKPVLEANSQVSVVNSYIAANLSPMHFRWDALYASRMRIGDGLGTTSHINIYAYCNDEHIDTALRQLCREVGGPAGRAAGLNAWLDPEPEVKQ